MSIRICIPDDYPPVFAGTEQLTELQTVGEVSYYDSAVAGEDELVERLRGCEFAIDIRARTPFNGAVLAQLPELRLIAVFGTGTDNIDLTTATELGILVTNAPGADARSVAEHVIGLMFAVVRSLPAYDRELRAGRWTHFPAMEIEGKTLGVVGLGSIGSQVAWMGNGLGMRTVAWSPTDDPQRAARLGVEQLSLAEVLRTADVLSLNLPATDGTRGLIGGRELALMRPHAVLINTARGALVDEPALVEALREKRLGGAGLDVFSEEPLSPDSPLLKLENVVLSPHAGWISLEAGRRLRDTPLRNIRAYLEGRPVNVVNPTALKALHRRPNPTAAAMGR